MLARDLSFEGADFQSSPTSQTCRKSSASLFSTVTASTRDGKLVTVDPDKAEGKASDNFKDSIDDDAEDPLSGKDSLIVSTHNFKNSGKQRFWKQRILCIQVSRFPSNRVFLWHLSIV